MKQNITVTGYRLLVIGLLFVSSSVHAQYTPAASSSALPATTMQSVNNASYMSAGSTYSSAVHEVGLSAPAAAPVRKAPPGTGGESTGYDPANPQFAPVGDALLPLLLMALAFAGVIYRRKNILTK